MSRWFRLYDEVLDDPKVQKLSPELFKFWINLLCLASKKDGVLPDAEAVSFALRTPFHETRECLDSLFQCGLLDQNKKGMTPHGWSKRQYKSDTSTDRVKRFRQRYRNVTPTVTETPPDTYTETDTDTEQKQIQKREKKVSRATRLPEDWQPKEKDWLFAEQEGVDAQRELAKFRNYWLAKPKDNTKLDWDATWRNWCMKADKRAMSRHEKLLDWVNNIKDENHELQISGTSGQYLGLGFSDPKRGR